MNLSIKNVPDELVERLRERAAKNHRSIQGELMSILEETLKPAPMRIEDVYREIKSLEFHTGDDAVSMIREDRDTH